VKRIGHGGPQGQLPQRPSRHRPGLRLRERQAVDEARKVAYISDSGLRSAPFPEHKELLAQHKALLAPALPGDMVRWPVSSRVGTVKNNDPSLIEPDFPR
jgi:hypothetical protein